MASSPTEPTIRLEGVSKRYRGGGGVEGLDLRIGPGEVFGFLGPNGAGKTTTIRLLLDLIRPDEGSIRIFGLDSRADSVAIRRRLGYLPGELSLYERMTARSLLGYFTRLRGSRSTSALEAEAADFDLELDRPIRSMSKGNRQKVGLVAAFMGEPELLLLDEPTSGLDPLVQQVVHAKVRSHAARGGTVFLSSHILSEVGVVADRVGLIRAGRLVTVQKVDEMRSRAAHLVEATFDGPVPLERFEALPGVSRAVVEGAKLHLELRGDLNGLVAELGRHRLEDLSIEEPDLETLFLSFYEASSAPGGDSSTDTGGGADA